MTAKSGSLGDNAQDKKPLGSSTRWLTFVGIAASLAISGCSGEPRVPVVPVSGTVSFQGKPPVGAQVVLQPVTATDVNGVVPLGTVKDDGSFVITSYDPNDGAPQGEYVATIRWYKLSKDGNPGPNVLPPVYATAKASPVKVSVGNGPVEIPPINIR